MDQDKDKDLTHKDQDKDLTPKDQNKDKDLTPKDKDLKNVLKESLRTRTRINIPDIYACKVINGGKFRGGVVSGGNIRRGMKYTGENVLNLRRTG